MSRKIVEILKPHRCIVNVVGRDCLVLIVAGNKINKLGVDADKATEHISNQLALLWLGDGDVACIIPSNYVMVKGFDNYVNGLLR